jgi:hypothetical protein
MATTPEQIAAIQADVETLSMQANSLVAGSVTAAEQAALETAACNVYTAVYDIVPDGTPPPPTGSVHWGAWCNNQSSAITALAAALGKTNAEFTQMSFATTGGGWANIESDALSQCTYLATWPGPKILALQFVNGALGGNAAFTDVTSGARDANLSAIYTAALKAGVTDIRGMWEFDNNTGTALAPGQTPPFGTYSAANFTAVFQHHVTIARAAGFTGRFWYNPNGLRNDAATLSAYFPGAGYVDGIAIDAYAESNGWPGYETEVPITWNALVSFALAQGVKNVGVMEYGMTPTSAGSWASGDMPAFCTGSLASFNSAAAQGLGVWVNVWAQNGVSSTQGQWAIPGFPNAWTALKTAVVAS